MQNQQVILFDGVNEVGVSVTDGDHKVGISYGDDLMELNLDGTTAETAYDGAWPAGDIVVGATHRELTRSSLTDYTAQKAQVAGEMP